MTQRHWTIFCAFMAGEYLSGAAWMLEKQAHPGVVTLLAAATVLMLWMAFHWPKDRP